MTPGRRLCSRTQPPRRPTNRSNVGWFPMLVALLVMAELVAGTPALGAEEQLGVTLTTIDDDWIWFPTAAGWALPAEYLGSSATVSFGSVTPVVTVPIASGIDQRGDRHPLTQIELVVDIADFVAEATVTIRLDETELYQVVLSGSSTTPLQLPVPPGVHEQLEIEIVGDLADGCEVGPQSSIAEITNLTFFYAEEPTEAATPGRPDVITAVDIGVKTDYSSAVSSAVLQATATVSHEYPGDQRIAVHATESRASSNSPFVLGLDILEGSESGVRRADGRLSIEGEGEELVLQSRGLLDALAVLDRTDEFRAASSSAQSVPVQSAALQSGPLSAEAIVGAQLVDGGGRRLQATIPLRQTAFNGPVERFDLNLHGVASPTSSSGGATQLSIWLGDSLIQTVTTDESGRFAAEFSVDAAQAGRSGEVRLEFATSESCGRSLLYHLQIDPDSTVHPIPGQSLDVGLQRFPQVAAPSLRVLPGNQPWELSIAADTLALLQEGSDHRLEPETSNPDDALLAGPPLLLVNPNPDFQDALCSPIEQRLGQLDVGRSLAPPNGSHEITFAIQAFVSEAGTDVLMVEANRIDQPGGLPDVLARDGVTTLTGSLLTVDAGGDIIAVAASTEDHAEHSPAPSTIAASSSGLSTAGSSFTRGLLMSFIAGGLFFALRGIRRRLY